MSTATPPKRSKEPCLQIQADLSAMLDGELDPASIRRVMVHSDVCDACKGFMRGIRSGAIAHRELASAFSDDPRASAEARSLRRQLVENRAQLAKILYELGRGFVMMGQSPSFSRVVSREPIPVPDMALRGRHLLDQVARQSSGAAGANLAGEWVRARDLFATGYGNSPAENLGKGIRLLREVLLFEPEFHRARIYLGHALHLDGDRAAARSEFEHVLAHAKDDAAMRAFALENLGNVWLEDGHPDHSIGYFLQVVESGIVKSEPRFFTSLFNLALAHGQLLDFAESKRWFQRLHDEFPHKRSMIARELRTRPQFSALLESDPAVITDFCNAFPCWFDKTRELR